MPDAREKPDVAAVFDRHPAAVRKALKALKATILETAAETDGVGLLEETLKWGQISYLTPATKSGTTIRIDARRDGGIAFFVNCQTDLVSRYREMYPRAFTYVADREVQLPASPDRAALKHCLALALTYHSGKKSK